MEFGFKVQIKFLIAAAAMVVSNGAFAASLNKCTGPTGSILYQDAPCDVTLKQQSIAVERPSALARQSDFPDLMYKFMLQTCVSEVGGQDRVMKEAMQSIGKNWVMDLDSQPRKKCAEKFNQFVQVFGRLDSTTSRKVSCDILHVLDEEIVTAKYSYEKSAYELERLQYRRRCNGERIFSISRPFPR